MLWRSRIAARGCRTEGVVSGLRDAHDVGTYELPHLGDCLRKVALALADSVIRRPHFDLLEGLEDVAPDVGVRFFE